MPFDFDIVAEKDIGIIYLEGNLTDRYEAAGFLDELDEHIAGKVNCFIIDLKKIDYLNSSGLSILLNILTKARNSNGEAVICNVSPKVKKLLIMTKLDAVFDFASTHAEAKKILSKSGKSDLSHGS